MSENENAVVETTETIEPIEPIEPTVVADVSVVSVDIKTVASTPDETNNAVKPADEAVPPTENKEEGKKMQTKTILRDAKFEGTARVDETKINKTTREALIADGYIEKGPRGCLYVTPKAVVAWPDLFDFDASPSYASRMRAIGKNGDAKVAKAPRKPRAKKATKVVTKSKTLKARKPRAAKTAVKPAKAKRNGNAKVNSLMTRAEKAFKRFAAVYVKTMNELATRATKD